MTDRQRIARLMIGAGRRVGAELELLRAALGGQESREAPAVTDAASTTVSPRWEEILHATDVGLRPGRPAIADTLLADPLLAAMVPAVRAILGDRLRAIILFGSRAREQARPDSDDDVLVLVNVENTAELHAALKPACPPPIGHELCGVREAWTSLLHDADVALLNMLTQGVVLDGHVPWILRQAVPLAIELFRLRPAPAISKGAWVSEWDLPPALPLLWHQRGEFPEGRREGGAIVDVGDEEGIDHLLRALVTVRVRGDLALSRPRLLELVEEHVLAGHEVQAVRGELGDRLRLASVVRQILTARYDDWPAEVLCRLQGA